MNVNTNIEFFKVKLINLLEMVIENSKNEENKEKLTTFLDKLLGKGQREIQIKNLIAKYNFLLKKVPKDMQINDAIKNLHKLDACDAVKNNNLKELEKNLKLNSDVTFDDLLNVENKAVIWLYILALFYSTETVIKYNKVPDKEYMDIQEKFQKVVLDICKHEALLTQNDDDTNQPLEHFNNMLKGHELSEGNTNLLNDMAKDVITNISNNDGNLNLMSIIQNVGNNFSEKLNKGDYDREQLLNVVGSMFNQAQGTNNNNTQLNPMTMMAQLMGQGGLKI